MAKPLNVLRKTRKAFLLEYLCGIFLLSLWGIFYFKGIKLRLRIDYLALGLGLLAIISGEFSRLLSKYIIEESKLTIVEGLLKQHKKHVYFYSLGFVTDINVKQSRWQRLWGYGSISLEGAGTTTFEIKDINKPEEVMRQIEELVEENRKKAHKEKTRL